MAIDIKQRDIEEINIPDCITQNLKFPLREYQQKALKRFLYYDTKQKIYDKEDNEIQKPLHLLWQMATGSGKTLIMAARDFVYVSKRLS